MVWVPFYLEWVVRPASIIWRLSYLLARNMQTPYADKCVLDQDYDANLGKHYQHFMATMDKVVLQKPLVWANLDGTFCCR